MDEDERLLNQAFLISWSCLEGHVLFTDDDIDLSLHVCPLCLGKVKGDTAALERWVLSRVQDGLEEHDK